MNEEKIIAQAQNGDQDAFGALVDRYQKFVWNVALRMIGDSDEAEDIAQDVFVTVWKKLPQFAGASAFSSWLYRITINRTLNGVKKEAVRRKNAGQLAQELAGGGSEFFSDPAYLSEKAECRTRLSELLEQLAPDRRMAVILREIEGLNYVEIAEATGAPVGTVRSRIARGRKDLEYLMGEREKTA